MQDLSALAGEIQTEVRGSVRDLKRELREATRQTRQTRWDRPAASGPPGPATPTTGGPPLLAEFDKRLAEFTVEVGALVRAGRLSDTQLRTAIRVLDGALDGLRRLLR
ncbi:hypothetical protein TPA0907_03050 [Micromonospora humidisoli]|uniref:hypothetical protein n=1 Tax=Micromonospora sp. AKA109 TaxID=2733865 RepID=UPI0022CA1DD6|nr:hypothetical protein [Micromonospora sp. AKA109]GHJ05938.1 hypothetical protein TPA0907_03050 [Micromonospora sp. AKA109]